MFGKSPRPQFSLLQSIEIGLDRWSLGGSQKENSVVLQQVFIAPSASGTSLSGQLKTSAFSA